MKSYGRHILAAIACILAYTLVFAHSVIPHDHHTHCGNDPVEAADQGNHSHYGSCEELGTFLPEDDECVEVCVSSDVLPSFSVMPAVAEATLDTPAEMPREDLPLPPSVPYRALRAPPASSI